MSESSFSECCSSDFTNYCPAGSLCDENIGSPARTNGYSRLRSSKVKSRIALFSKKSKPSLSYRRQVSVRPLGEGYRSEDGVHLFNEPPPSSYVSQEELKALEGCVSRRRAVFSPNFNAPPSSSQTVPRQKSARTYRRDPIPKRGYTVLTHPSSCDDHPIQFKKHDSPLLNLRHQRQQSTEYDHLEDYYPLSQSSVPDSVSIQFRSDSQECVSLKNCDSNFRSENVQSGCQCEMENNLGTRKSSCHFCHCSSIPGRLNSPNLRFQRNYLPRLQHVPRPCKCGGKQVDESLLSSSSGMHSLMLRPARTKLCACETTCNSWPRNLVCLDRHCEHDSSHVELTVEKSLNHNLYHMHRQESPLDMQHSKFMSTDVISSNLGSTASMCSLQSHQSSTTSNVSSCFDRPHCSYAKGVDGMEFKDKSERVVSWFSQFNDQQRNMLLLKLLEQCDCAQMHFLSLQMEPVLHIGCPHNCQDLLSWLPSCISDQILAFLDPVSLCRASQVSHGWYQLANQSKLWMSLCKLSQWQLSTFGETTLIKAYTLADGSVQWKSLFAEKFRLKRNWLKGYCTVRTFEGHTQGISCIQFDNTRIVSGSWDKTIKVWNRRTNTVWAALTLAGHSGTVRCLHLHGNRLVSGSSDRTIKVWDLSTDKIGWVGAACRATMVGHMHTVRCLQADDNKVISGSYDLTLKVWDIRTGQCTKTLRGHTDAVLCLQFDEDDVVSGSKDMTIKVWSLRSEACKLTLHGHQAAVTCVQFDKTKIISGALDTLIKIWNFSNGECIRTIDWIRSEGHTGVIRHLQADSWKIISAADDKTMKVWSVHTGDRLLTLKSHTDGVTCLQFNDEVIVSGSYDKTVKLWDFSAC